MSSPIVKEADRVMTICNACRYCEGICAVFPAMELRRIFTTQDLKYLANLCHNCRGCYYACQYAPPHEFALNFPKAMGELRAATYAEFTWPKAMKAWFMGNGLLVTLMTLLGVAGVMLLALLGSGWQAFFGVHTGDNSFYKVIPYAAMLVPFTLLGIFLAVSFYKAARTMWAETGGAPGDFWNIEAHIQAVKDMAKLRFLDGGGDGCNYPDDRFSMIRRNLHHATFYGFMLCLASTTIAFFYDHMLHLPAPYGPFSLPVLLGTLGGLGIVGGTGGLLWLKWKMDRDPAVPGALGMDVTFIVLLLLTALSGLLLLFFRSTACMGTLLAVHLGLVLALFVTMPYGKFIHAVHRYMALVRNALEQARAGAGGKH